MDTYLLTWNPKIWPESQTNWLEEMEMIESGGRAPSTWSTGGTRRIQPGDRAYLLRQGVEPRGIVASGWFTSEVFRDEHFNEQGKHANYADVEWDAMTAMDDPLPLETLLQQVPGVKWRYILASGQRISEAAAEQVDALWSDFIGSISSEGPGRGRSAGQRRLPDAEVRKAIEDYAQAMLTDHYVADGWDVVDRRYGNPYDAIARKAGKVKYLEAKGTQGHGKQVLVTSGEVEFALDHPGECVIGIVTGIVIDEEGRVVPRSGELSVMEWDPSQGELTPQNYAWRPDHEPQERGELTTAQREAAEEALAAIGADARSAVAVPGTMLGVVPVVVIGTARGKAHRSEPGEIEPLFVLAEDELEVRGPSEARPTTSATPVIGEGRRGTADVPRRR